jgi:uncharacterized membrane protein YbhN (UPF0104 family)
LFIPNIQNYYLFILSIIFVQISFLLDIYTKQILYFKTNNIIFKHILESEYIYIFNKYIPGKIMTIISPISYIKEKYPNLSLKYMSYLFIILQLTIISSALLIAIITYENINLIYILLYLLLIFILFIISTNNKISIYILNLIQKNIQIINLSIKEYIYLIFLSILFWLFLSFGFYLFTKSIISIDNIDYKFMFALSIAISIGVLSLFSPGGLGVREAILTTLLLQYNFSLEDAISISIFSRIWFIINELILFIIGLISKMKI